MVMANTLMSLLPMDSVVCWEQLNPIVGNKILQRIDSAPSGRAWLASLDAYVDDNYC